MNRTGRQGGIGAGLHFLQALQLHCRGFWYERAVISTIFLWMVQNQAVPELRLTGTYYAPTLQLLANHQTAQAGKMTG
jgi:hypothetical protein